MRIEDKFNLRLQKFQTKFGENDANEKKNNSSEFSSVLKNYVDDVNKSLTESNKTTNAFVKGEDVTIDEVMVKASEASLNLQFLTTTRDKLVEGYKELIKMQ